MTTSTSAHVHPRWVLKCSIFIFKCLLYVYIIVVSVQGTNKALYNAIRASRCHPSPPLFILYILLHQNMDFSGSNHRICAI